MQLPITRPGRRDLISHAIAGMNCLDITGGTYRTEQLAERKGTWIRTVMEDPGHQNRIGGPGPDFQFICSTRGTWAVQYDAAGRGVPTFVLGPKPVTDLGLALVAAQISRILGAPAGQRAATGPVHDRAAVMLMTSALAVHDPDRAEQFHRFCAALRLTMTDPAAPWPWAAA